MRTSLVPTRQPPSFDTNHSRFDDVDQIKSIFAGRCRLEKSSICPSQLTRSLVWPSLDKHTKVSDPPHHHTNKQFYKQSIIVPSSFYNFPLFDPFENFDKMKVFLGLLAIGTSAAFAPSTNMNRGTKFNLSMVAGVPDLYTSTGVIPTSSYAPPITAPVSYAPGGQLAKATSVPTGTVMPLGDLYDYDRAVNPGSVMPDAQRQRKPVNLPKIRDQQMAIGVFFATNNAGHSRGLSMTNRKKA